MPALDFDDGNAKVPGGIVGSVDRVIVIGAGISGLTAANALSNAGVECVVLEGRERVGGRLHTVIVDGHPVDLGGSWIHMPIGNPLTTFAELADVPRHSGDPTGDIAAFDCIDDRWLSAQEWAASLALQYDAFPEAQAGLISRLAPDASMDDAIDAFLATAALPAAESRRAWQALHAIVEAESADVAGHQSLQWMWNEAEYDGSYFGDFPAGGYAALTTAMASTVDVRLGVDVAEISWSRSGVSVRDRAGLVEQGSHVVVTVPLGVLKSGRLRFDPGLPADRKAAIARLGFGRFEKVVMAFDEPFWRRAGSAHLVLFPPDAFEPAIWILGQDAFDTGPVLVALIFHTSAQRVVDQPPRANADWLLGMIGRAIGEPCPAPTTVIASSWALDPFSFGAYTHITPEASPTDCDLLGEPLDGRILFAGEHTQSERLAYADGAMTSGIREAKRLLGTSTVRLVVDAAT